MGDEKYQLMYSGLAEGVDEANVKTLIHERFRMPMASIERWFGKQRAVIGRELSQDQAWKTQYLFESMGVQTIVVQQTRSNLALNSLQMESADARPAVTVNRFQPNGMVEFEARPVSRQHRVSPARRRPPEYPAGGKIPEAEPYGGRGHCGGSGVLWGQAAGG